MGSCSARLTLQEEAEHAKYEDHTNDYRFVVIPDLNKMSLASADVGTLANQLKLLRLKKSMIRGRLDTFKGLTSNTSCLAVEIRKGKDIFPQQSCFNPASIRVRAKLEPGGPSFETQGSISGMPKWYRLFEVKQSVEESQSLELDVIVNYASASEVFGTCSIRLLDLISQECYKEWLPIETTAPFSETRGSPMLEVRVQYLFNEEKVFLSYSATIQEMIDNAAKLISQSHSRKSTADSL
jgi:hypothetical protein